MTRGTSREPDSWREKPRRGLIDKLGLNSNAHRVESPFGGRGSRAPAPLFGNIYGAAGTTYSLAVENGNRIPILHYIFPT